MEQNNSYVFEFIEILKNRKEIPHKYNVTCSENDLAGVKENIAMELEREYGNQVFCVNVIKVEKVARGENNRK